jgi:LmbE family N-acetylglucosaminyl deacetylase
VIAALCVPAELETRVDEAGRAAGILGAESVVVFDGGCSRVEDVKSHELVRRLDALVVRLGPAAMFSHGRADHHRDHLLTFDACRAAQRLRFMDFFCYYPAACRPTPVAFCPQAYVDVTDTLDTKLLAIEAHESQFKKRGLDVAFQRDLARYYGSLSGTTYAEGLEVVQTRVV